MRLISFRLAVMACALALAGCEAPEQVLRAGVNPVQDLFGWNEEKVARDTWLSPLPFVPPPSYCYRTLAQSDCYLRPQPGASERLVGYIGPPPY